MHTALSRITRKELAIAVNTDKQSRLLHLLVLCDIDSRGFELMLSTAGVGYYAAHVGISSTDLGTFYVHALSGTDGRTLLSHIASVARRTNKDISLFIWSSSLNSWLMV